MALEFGFFNSQNHDRAYSTEDFSRIFDGIINDGIFDSIGDHFAVTATGNMRDIRVGSGRAWLNSTWTWNTADYPIRLENVTNNIYKRIDAICIKVDHSDGVRANSIAVVKGAQGTEPEKPEIPEDNIEAGVYYHVIAYVTVSYDTIITNAEIENMIGMEGGTPYVTGILATTSVDELWNQWDGEFNNWWENIKNILDTDTVTRLQNEIDHLKPSAETILRYFPKVEAAGYYPIDAILKELSLDQETWGQFFAEGEMPTEMRYNALFNKISSLFPSEVKWFFIRSSQVSEVYLATKTAELGYGTSDAGGTLSVNAAITKSTAPISIGQYYRFKQWFIKFLNVSLNQIFLYDRDTVPEIPTDFKPLSDVPDNGVTLSVVVYYPNGSGNIGVNISYTVPKSEFEGKNIISVNPPTFIDPVASTVTGYYAGNNQNFNPYYPPNPAPRPSYLSRITSLPYILTTNGDYFFIGQ